MRNGRQRKSVVHLNYAFLLTFLVHTYHNLFYIDKYLLDFGLLAFSGVTTKGVQKITSHRMSI